MIPQKYSVNHYPIATLLTWVNSKEIAIPEIQRPFVWNAIKVRDFLDSLYNGYPVGYLIAWRNPRVKLKDGTSSEGKRILIDGQQRVTALTVALHGKEVLNKDYEKVRIRIAFNPIERKFEVANPAIQKNQTWIYDISSLFDHEIKILEFVNAYCQRNPGVDQNLIFSNIEQLLGIQNNSVGFIELNSDLSIETVTEIFIRINSQGMPLSQADFAMSKIATNEVYGGNILRKAIDYFCYMTVTPEFYDKIVRIDPDFAKTDFFKQMMWLKKENDDIYNPSYTDMLRVAFTSEFKRGRLEDLVALLSGRNFDTKQYEEVIAEESFSRLKQGIMNFVNETHFKRYVMIVRSAGFIDSSLIGSQNALNFGYIIYLTLRSQKIPPDEIESQVRKWLVMSMLTGRYSGSPESTFDYDIKKIYDQGFGLYALSLEKAVLSDAFWDATIPQGMNISVTSSPYFRVYLAAQVKMKDKGFLSKDITVQDLILNKNDVHHIFPKNYLKKLGFDKGRYNQIANFVMTQSEINISIGNQAPTVYFNHLIEQCHGGKKYYGGIVDENEMRENFYMNCIPKDIEKLSHESYDQFLQERRKMIAQKLKMYYQSL